jgi:FHS family L-fucose permease-like MFS transporter
MTLENRRTRTLLYAVYAIYFLNGMALCFEGAFNPEFKDYFGLDYQQQMYTMFAKNIPFVIAVAIGFAAARIGFKNCLTLAMALFAAGTLLLVPGLQSGRYGVVLLALFIIGLGFNFQLVAGNPLLSGLGSPQTGSSRLNLGNALGAVAQIIAPLVLTFIIPATAVSVQEKLPYMKGLFAAIGVVLFAVAVLTVLARNVDIRQGLQPEASASTSDPGARSLWARPKVVLGFVTVFLVLGAEAGFFGLYRNFLQDPRVTMPLSSHESQRMFTVYFAVFALGRLVGSWVQKRVRPAVTLAFSAGAALVLLGLVVLTQGTVAIVSITVMGFFISIFFPTLYSLATQGLGEDTAKASGLLTTGFLGCALLPVLQGRLADMDAVGLQRSFAMAFLPYGMVLFYALKGHTLQGRRAESTQ